MTTTKINEIVKETLGEEFSIVITFNDTKHDNIEFIIKDERGAIASVDYNSKRHNVFGVRSIDTIFFANKYYLNDFLKLIIKLEEKE